MCVKQNWTDTELGPLWDAAGADDDNHFLVEQIFQMQWQTCHSHVFLKHYECILDTGLSWAMREFWDVSWAFCLCVYQCPAQAFMIRGLAGLDMDGLRNEVKVC